MESATAQKDPGQVGASSASRNCNRSRSFASRNMSLLASWCLRNCDLNPSSRRPRRSRYTALRKNVQAGIAEAQADIARMRSTLTPQQQARLARKPWGRSGRTITYNKWISTSRVKRGRFVYSLHPYPDPTDAWLYKELDLSTAQQREVRRHPRRKQEPGRGAGPRSGETPAG